MSANLMNRILETSVLAHNAQMLRSTAGIWVL